MGDEEFDDLTRAAGDGMSRRKLLRLLTTGTAAGAAAGLGLRGRGADAAARAASGGSSAQVGGLCAALMTAAAQVSGIPVLGPFLASLLAGIGGAFGCEISDAPPTTSPPTTTTTTAPPPTTTTTTPPKKCLCTGNPSPPPPGSCVFAGQTIRRTAFGSCVRDSIIPFCFPIFCTSTHVYTCRRTGARLTPFLTSFSDDCP